MTARKANSGAEKWRNTAPRCRVVRMRPGPGALTLARAALRSPHTESEDEASRVRSFRARDLAKRARQLQKR